MGAARTGRRALALALAAALLGRARTAEPHACPANFSSGDLPPSLSFCDGARVESPADWALRRAQIGALLQANIYGTLPEGPPPALLSVTLTNSTSERGNVRAWYRAEFERSLGLEFEAIYADAACGGGASAAPCPVLLVSREHRRWAVAAALRGYVAVSLCVGDSCPWATTAWAAAFPAATFQLIAQRAYVASRALDAVLALPRAAVRADGARVAITGHSRNGKLALIAAAFDARIGAVVDSSSGAAGILPYRLSGGEAQCERPDSSWPGAWWLPSLRGFDGREDALPVDSHNVAALVAPRPLLVASATNDGVEPSFAVERALGDAAQVYAFLGAPARALALDYRPGDHHGFESVQRYLDFLDVSFNHSAPGQPAAASPRAFPLPRGSGAGAAAGDSGADGRLHAFNWSAWAGLAGPIPSPPPPTAPARDRWQWLLGDAPSLGLAWDSGGSYPPADDLGYADQLMLRDEGAAAFPAVARVDAALGANVIGASLLFRRDMLARPPPTPAGWPAVVFLHGSNYNKASVASYAPAGSALVAPAHALANRSVVVLTYDQIGAGLRIEEGSQFYARFPRWSRLGAAVFDAASAVDLLATAQGAGADQAGSDDALPPYPPVDPARVFLVGYGSLGGAAALLAAGGDARVAGVATVCGWTPLRNDTDASRSGGIRRLFEQHASLPRLGLFADGRGAPADIPADFDDALGLVRPRPALVVQPTGDRSNDAAQVAAAVARARAAGGGYAALELQTPAGVNALGDAAVAAVAEWVERVGGA